MADFGIGEALLAASTAASAGGAIVGAMGQSQAGAEQAQALTTNAAIQRQNARIAMTQARSQAAIDKQQSEIAQGNVAAAFGSAGVTATEGSPLDVMKAQAAQGELTQQLDIYKGVVSAQSALDQSKLYGIEASSALAGGQTAATGTLLTGFGAAARSAGPLFGGATLPGAAQSTAAQSNFNTWASWANY